MVCNLCKNGCPDHVGDRQNATRVSLFVLLLVSKFYIFKRVGHFFESEGRLENKFLLSVVSPNRVSG